MIHRLTRWICALALICPLAVSATPVTWDFSGTFTSATGSGLPPDVAAGNPFSLSFTFDPATTGQLVACVPGAVSGCVRLLTGGSMAFSVTTPGGSCTPCSSATPYAGTRISVVNDFDNTNNGIADGVDGLVFNVIDSSNTLWRLVFSSFDLTTLNGTDLPTTLDPRFGTGSLLVCAETTLSDQTWGCKPDDFQVRGTVGVPEPATLGLLGLGLAGFGVSRRRRQIA